MSSWTVGTFTFIFCAFKCAELSCGARLRLKSSNFAMMTFRTNLWRVGASRVRTFAIKSGWTFKTYKAQIKKIITGILYNLECNVYFYSIFEPMTRRCANKRVKKSGITFKLLCRSLWTLVPNTAKSWYTFFTVISRVT